ncbi:hypothetical protein [Aromatoleum buckelii]|uniref:Uncharacterized protein n=1 Tax=Aromatoleum buckelii TaxID=200254 RepID=A0ABX1N3W4_9RHOO|nr:hypothetical protein [Aromatoleum buckelii]MCK0511487.1 hypothetical protein [Aromatoleum buckelii]
MHEQDLRQTGAANSIPAGLSQYICPECGISVSAGEYHPYAACLMVGGCHDGATIREALMAVFEDGMRVAAEKCRCGGGDALADKIESLMRSDAD